MGDADAQTGLDAFELGQDRVGADLKISAVKAFAQGLRRLDHAGFTVKSQNHMVAQIGQGLGRRAARQIVAMGKKAQGDLGHFAGDQIVLRGAEHADGDIGIPAQQIGGGIADHQLQFDIRVGAGKIWQQMGQRQGAQNLIRGDAHDARQIGVKTRRLPFKLCGCGQHLGRCGHQIGAAFGQRHAVPPPTKESGAKPIL